MYPTQITQDGYSWDIFAMESQHTRGVRVQMALFLREWHRAMVFMLSVICGGDLRQKSRNHFNNVRDRHGADFILSCCI